MFRELKPEIKLERQYIVYFMIIIYTAVFSYYTITKHYAFLTQAYDMGIFLNSFYNTLHGGGFFYTTLWEGSRFQNHFGPILFLILPIYSLFQNAETLLILQSFMLALGALPIYWIAKKEINYKVGLAFALLYLAYPALQGINLYDFHEVSLAPTMILFSFYYFKEKRYNISAVFIILALISREDVAMVIVPMAVFWFFEKKREWPISISDKETMFCISTIFVGLIWFFITTKFIIPHYNPQGYWFITEYKPEFLFLNIKKKITYIIDMGLPLLFIPFLNRLILISLPIFARNLFSNRTTRFRINNQHQALIVPFIFLSSIYFIKDISRINLNRPLIKTIAYSITVICLAISFYLSPTIAEIYSKTIISSPVPDGWPSQNDQLMTITPHNRALNKVIEMVPTNASVYVQHNIFPHIANRDKVYYVLGDRQFFKGWNNPQIGGAIVPWQYTTDFEYILVDDSMPKYSLLRRTDLETLDLLRDNYGLYVAIDRIYLFKKGYNSSVEPLPSLLENFDNHFISNYYNGIKMSYYNNNNLSGYPVLIDRSPNINFRWNKASPIPGVINEKNFSIKFEGYLYIPMNDSYTFQILAGEGTRLYIDDNSIIDAWYSPQIDSHFQIYLTKGLHKIRIDYNDNKYDSYINLKWSTSWSTLKPIPEEYFYIPKTVLM